MTDVLTKRDGAVLTITLNRPDAFNAFNQPLHGALADALAEAADPSIRAVVITGAGKAFCAGQDIGEFQQLTEPIDVVLERSYHPNVRAIRALEKPVIAAVNGAAAGAGLSLALVCDVRIASETAVFVPGFVGIGLVPDAGGSWFAERLLGAARAFEWLCSNRRLSAAEALSFGLVTEVLPQDGFVEAVAERAATWAALPTVAVARTKRLLAEAAGSTLDEQLAREGELQGEAIASADHAEGVAAFLEKRRARFAGS